MYNQPENVGESQELHRKGTMAKKVVDAYSTKQMSSIEGASKKRGKPRSKKSSTKEMQESQEKNEHYANNNRQFEIEREKKVKRY